MDWGYSEKDAPKYTHSHSFSFLSILRRDRENRKWGKIALLWTWKMRSRAKEGTRQSRVSDRACVWVCMCVCIQCWRDNLNISLGRKRSYRTEGSKGESVKNEPVDHQDRSPGWWDSSQLRRSSASTQIPYLPFQFPTLSDNATISYGFMGSHWRFFLSEVLVLPLS